MGIGYMNHLFAVSALFFFSVPMLWCSLISIEKWLTLGQAHRVKLTPTSGS